MNRFDGKVAFVSGANRGLGLAFVKGLLSAGVSKVYAGAREIDSLHQLVRDFPDKVVPVRLDVTNDDLIADAVNLASDVDIVINNAGVATFDSLSSPRNIENAKYEMDVNYFGALNMVRAFSPVLKAQGGGAFVNIASIAGLISFPFFSSYSASKAAVHSLIQGTRAELAKQNTYVMGVYPGPVDTDFAVNIPAEKASPEAVVANVLEALEKGEEDVFPDASSQQIVAGIQADAKGMEKHIASLGA